MGGNTACAATCQSCNSTANLVIDGRADKENFINRDDILRQFNDQKSLEDLFLDKEKIAQYAEMLTKLRAN